MGRQHLHCRRDKDCRRDINIFALEKNRGRRSFLLQNTLLFSACLLGWALKKRCWKVVLSHGYYCSIIYFCFAGIAYALRNTILQIIYMEFLFFSMDSLKPFHIGP